MRRRWICLAGGILVFSLLVMLLSRISGAFADFWLKWGMGPALQTLSRLSGSAPFSLAEPLPLIAAVLLLVTLLRRKGTCLLLALIFAGYALLWYPAYFAPSAQGMAVESTADAGKLESVCRELIDALNADAFAMPQNLEERALSAVSRLENLPFLPASAPKGARYPEWMEALHLAGIFAPWTAEALFNPLEAEAGRLFTACHELMHLSGIADEGQANILAYEACLLEGGAFAYSARLWALKYCLQKLRELDAARYWETAGILQGEARTHFAAMGGFLRDSQEHRGISNAFSRFFGLSAFTSSYAALADYLCME